MEEVFASSIFCLHNSGSWLWLIWGEMFDNQLIWYESILIYRYYVETSFLLVDMFAYIMLRL